MNPAAPTLDEMPPSIRAAAARNEHFRGNGTPATPFVGGWIVDGRALSYDTEAHAWLNAHGFRHHGRRWCRADDAEQRV